MEYAADRCAGLVAGSDAAGAALSKLLRLSIASQITHAQLREFWRERRLVDDLPALVTSKVKQVSQQLLDEFEEKGRGKETKVFRTHPATSERVRRIKKLNTKGIVRRDGPARLLFQNFDAISKAATLVHYREMISRNVSTDNLISAKRILCEEEEADRESQAIEQYFGHEIFVCRPILFDDPHIQPTDKPKATVQKLKEAHLRISKAIFKIAQAYHNYDKAENGLIVADQASALIRAKVKIDYKDFKLQAATLEAVEDARHRCEAIKRKEGDILLTYEKVLRLRLNCALQLLSVPKIAERIKNANGLLLEAQRIVSVLARLRDFFGRFIQLRIDLETTVALLQAASYDPENAALFETIRSRLSNMIECVREARSELRDVTYPFTHADGKISVAQYAIEYIPAGSDLGEALHTIETFSDNVMALYLRSIGRLAYNARQVERVLGLPKLQIKENIASESA